MNCAWMSISDPNDPDYSAPFQNAYDPIRDAFVFKVLTWLWTPTWRLMDVLLF